MTPSILADSRNRFSVAWVKFLQKFQKDPMGELWIFEGKEDVEYYASRIEACFGSAPHKGTIIANGKGNALQLRDITSRNKIYEHAKIAYFVDADFDDPIQLQGIHTYVTPTYSIENLYLNECTVDGFLTEQLALYDEDDRKELASILKIFSRWRDNAAEILLAYCAILILAKTHEEAHRETINLIKDNIYKKVLSIKRTESEVGLQEIIGANEVLRRHSPGKINQDQLESQLAAMKVGGDLSYKRIRGKFLLPILSASLSLFIEDTNRRREQKFFSRRRSCSHQIRDAELLSLLSRHARTPPCLTSFLKRLAIEWQALPMSVELSLGK